MTRYYYADAVDGGRVFLLAGPFSAEGDARAALQRVRCRALDRNPRLAFAAFGTCSFADYRGRGALEAPGSDLA